MSFDQALVCQEIASGKSLREVAQTVGLKSASSITNRAASDPIFDAQYARAMELRADWHAQRIEELADKVEAGLIPPDAGRVAIDARKWTASKLRPKRYGDKLQLDADVRMQVELVDATAVQATATLISREDPST